MVRRKAELTGNPLVSGFTRLYRLHETFFLLLRLAAAFLYEISR
jgi:hypothetical protein